MTVTVTVTATGTRRRETSRRLKGSTKLTPNILALRIRRTNLSGEHVTNKHTVLVQECPCLQLADELIRDAPHTDLLVWRLVLCQTVAIPRRAGYSSSRRPGVGGTCVRGFREMKKGLRTFVLIRRRELSFFSFAPPDIVGAFREKKRRLN